MRRVFKKIDSDKVRDIMNEKKLTNTNVAHKTGRNDATISRWILRGEVPEVAFHIFCEALNSDAYCYWITTLVEPEEKDGKKARPYEKRVSGYTRTFSESVISYIESALRRSEATDGDKKGVQNVYTRIYSRLSDLHRNRTDRPACMGGCAV